MSIPRLHNVMRQLGKIMVAVEEAGEFGDRFEPASALHDEAITLLAQHMPEGISVPLDQYKHYGQLRVDRRGLVFRLVGLDGDEYVENGVGYTRIVPQNDEHALPRRSWSGGGKALGQIDQDAACEFHFAPRVEGLKFARLVVATFELGELMADLHRMDPNAVIGLHYVQVQQEAQRVVRAIQPIAERLEAFAPLTFDYDSGDDAHERMATLLVTRHGLSVLARTVPAAAIARVVAGRAAPEDHRRCETSEVITPYLHFSNVLLAEGLLQTIHEVGTAMIAEGGFDADQGEALMNTLAPWTNFLGATTAAE